MKKYIIFGLIILSTLSGKAQLVLPVETKVNYLNEADGIPENITYFKDINHVLDKYIGTWKGTQDNKNYEFKITKYTDTFEGLTEDILLIRYFITNSNGSIIIDTRSVADDGFKLIRGDYFRKSTYLSTYSGEEPLCGQSGNVFLWLTNTYNTEMKLFLEPDKILLDSETCPNGGAIQVLPLSPVVLTKQ